MNYWAWGVACLIAGPLVIGGGGFLTTFGWDLIGKHSSREALIDAVSHELDQNKKYLADFDTAKEMLNELDSGVVLPKFHYASIQELRTSAFYSSLVEQTQVAISTYLANASPANDLIEMLNESSNNERTSLERKKENFQSVYSSRIMTDFRRHHEALYTALNKRE